MRKIIETSSTVALWAVWIIGSGIAIFDFFGNADLSQGIRLHLAVIAWSPVVAISVLALMLVAIRFSGHSEVKKIQAVEHDINWSASDLLKAQNGKVVDLHFEGTGLSCSVLSRQEAALILHNENQIPHTNFAPETHSEDSAWFWKKIVARSLVLIVFFMPKN